MERPPTVNTYNFPPNAYVAKATITLSALALAAARDCARTQAALEPHSNWIVGFRWFVTRSTRRTKTREEFDEGPGIDVHGFRDSEINTATVENYDGVPVVYIISADIVAKAEEKRIIEVKLNSGRRSFALV